MGDRPVDMHSVAFPGVLGRVLLLGWGIFTADSYPVGVRDAQRRTSGHRVSTWQRVPKGCLALKTPPSQSDLLRTRRPNTPPSQSDLLSPRRQQIKVTGQTSSERGAQVLSAKHPFGTRRQQSVLPAVVLTHCPPVDKSAAPMATAVAT